MSRLKEQRRSPKSGARPYRMQQRASQVDDTRRRITEAAVRLHTSVGPSETSFAAVADEAGVTRLTLYRHFASRDELFAACMSHWREQHPPPDIDAWRSERSFDRRLRRAVDELYGWYEENAGRPLPGVPGCCRHPGSHPACAPREHRAHDRCDPGSGGCSASGASGSRGRRPRPRVLDVAVVRGRRGMSACGGRRARRRLRPGGCEAPRGPRQISRSPGLTASLARASATASDADRDCPLDRTRWNSAAPMASGRSASIRS